MWCDVLLAGRCWCARRTTVCCCCYSRSLQPAAAGLVSQMLSFMPAKESAAHIHTHQDSRTAMIPEVEKPCMYSIDMIMCVVSRAYKYVR